MGHKPGGSSSYPVGSTYQTTAPAAEFNLYGATGDLGSAAGLEYKTGYPHSKSTNGRVSCLACVFCGGRGAPFLICALELLVSGDC